MASADTTAREGRCLCGAVRFRALGAPLWVAHCHCASCRRATASPFTTYAGYPDAAVGFSGTTPATYASSPGVTRSFCPRCGTPIAFVGARWPGETHLFVASFDDPGDFEPKAHVNTIEQLPWIHLGDGLKRLPRVGAASAPPKSS